MPRLVLRLVLVSLVAAAAGRGTALAQHAPIAPERIFSFERQPVTVPDFEAKGWILAGLKVAASRTSGATLYIEFVKPAKAMK